MRRDFKVWIFLITPLSGERILTALIQSGYSVEKLFTKENSKIMSENIMAIWIGTDAPSYPNQEQITNFRNKLANLLDKEKVPHHGFVVQANSETSAGSAVSGDNLELIKKTVVQEQREIAKKMN